MEILLWLVPAALATAGATVWVGWLAREGRGEVDRDVAVQRLAKALEKDHRGSRRRALPDRPARVADRSTGIAVRPTRTGPGGGPSAGSAAGPETRRAS